jgi:hypothetical protein
MKLGKVNCPKCNTNLNAATEINGYGKYEEFRNLSKSIKSSLIRTRRLIMMRFN